MTPSQSRVSDSRTTNSGFRSRHKTAAKQSSEALQMAISPRLLRQRIARNLLQRESHSRGMRAPSMLAWIGFAKALRRAVRVSGVRALLVLAICAGTLATARDAHAFAWMVRHGYQ